MAQSQKKKTQIVSLVPVRTKPVLTKEFNKAALKKLSYDEEPNYNPRYHSLQESEQECAFWNKYIPMTPQQALKILRRGLPRDTEIRFNLHEDGTGVIEFDSKAFTRFDFEFDLKEHKRTDGYANVDRRYREKGYGRTALRNQIEFLHACRVNRFSVYAAMTAGGYMWARAGYLPDDVKDDSFASSVKEDVQKRYHVLRPLLTKKERAVLDKAVEFNKRQDLWRVADADMDIAKRYHDVFNKAANNNVPKAKRKAYQKAISDIKNCSETEDEIPRWKDMYKKGKPMKLGRILLSGTSWDGYINLKSVRQMERVGSYVGGWKYIKLKKPKNKP